MRPTDQGEGQCHFHRKLQMFPGSNYTSDVAWGSFRPCHLPQSFTVLSYYLPGTHRGKRQKISPMPSSVHLPISLSYSSSLSNCFCSKASLSPAAETQHCSLLSTGYKCPEMALLLSHSGLSLLLNIRLTPPTWPASPARWLARPMSKPAR